jgi:hypothetical protein
LFDAFPAVAAAKLGPKRQADQKIVAGNIRRAIADIADLFSSSYQHNARWDCHGDEAPRAMETAAS